MISSYKIHLTLFLTLIFGCNLLHSMAVPAVAMREGRETKTEHAATQESQQNTQKKLIAPFSSKRIKILLLPLYKQEATLNAICEDYQKQLLASEKDAHATALDRLKKVPNNQGLCDISKDWRAWFEWRKSQIECPPYESEEDVTSKRDEYAAKDMANLQRYLKSALQPAFSTEFQQEFTKIVHGLYKKHKTEISWRVFFLPRSINSAWKNKKYQATLQERQNRLMALFSNQEKLKIDAIAEDENIYDILDADDIAVAKNMQGQAEYELDDEYTLIDKDNADAT